MTRSPSYPLNGTCDRKAEPACDRVVQVDPNSVGTYRAQPEDAAIIVDTSIVAGAVILPPPEDAILRPVLVRANGANGVTVSAAGSTVDGGPSVGLLLNTGAMFYAARDGYWSAR